MGTSESLVKSVRGDTLVMDRHPIQRRVVILLVVSSLRIAWAACVPSVPLPTLPLYYQLDRQQTSASPLQCLIWVYCSQIYELRRSAKKWSPIISFTDSTNLLIETATVISLSGFLKFLKTRK